MGRSRRAAWTWVSASAWVWTAVAALFGGVAQAETRLALVITMENYAAAGPFEALTTPHADGARIAAALQAHGFAVTHERDLSEGSMIDAIDAHARRLGQVREGDRAVGLFYFAGHGVATSATDNLLVPVTATSATPRGLRRESVTLADVEAILTEHAPTAEHIIVVDACRAPLVSATRSSGVRGFAAFEPPAGGGPMFWAFSTGFGTLAADDAAEGEATGPYATALARALTGALVGSGLTTPEVFDAAAAEMLAIRPTQAPATRTRGSLSVRFGPPGQSPPIAQTAPLHAQSLTPPPRSFPILLGETPPQIGLRLSRRCINPWVLASRVTSGFMQSRAERALAAVFERYGAREPGARLFVALERRVCDDSGPGVSVGVSLGFALRTGDGRAVWGQSLEGRGAATTRDAYATGSIGRIALERAVDDAFTRLTAALIRFAEQSPEVFAPVRTP